MLKEKVEEEEHHGSLSSRLEQVGKKPEKGSRNRKWIERQSQGAAKSVGVLEDIPPMYRCTVYGCVTECNRYFVI